MNRLPWRALAMTLLIGSLLIGYSYWLRRDTDPLTTLSAASQPGYYLLDARIIETGSTGAQRVQLQAKRITQNLSDDSISLNTVQLHYVTDSATAWQLTADTGQLPAAAQFIEFSGNVQIQSSRGQAQVHSRTLQVDLANSQARTSDVVTVMLDGQQLTARGLRADLKRQQLQLDSQVHGVFNAQH